MADANHTEAELIAERYKSEIEVKLVRIYSNNGFGPASSRNAGIHLAKGDVIISLDSDMICPPSFLESHMCWFHSSAKIATIGLRKFVKANRIQPEDIIRDFHIISSLPEISISNTVIGSRRDKRIPELKQLMIHPFPSNCFHGGNVAYWRDDAYDVGLWDEDFNGNYGYEDIDFGQRLFDNHTKLIFENGATAYHQESNVVSHYERQKGLSINRIKLYERYLALARFRRHP